MSSDDIRMVSEDALTASHLSTGFSGRGVIEDVSLDLHQREIAVLLGPNGCGKTTLLRILAGLSLAPNQHFTGKVERRVPRSYLDQNYSATLLPWYSARKNALIGATLSRNRDSSRVLDLESATEVLGVGRNLPWDSNPEQLSGGQKQLLAVLRLIVLNRPLMFLDEPFSALDRATQIVIANSLRKETQRQGWTILVVLHDLQMACLIGDRCLPLVGNPATLGASIRLPPRRGRAAAEYLAAEDVQEVYRSLIGQLYS